MSVNLVDLFYRWNTQKERQNCGYVRNRGVLVGKHIGSNRVNLDSSSEFTAYKKYSIAYVFDALRDLVPFAQFKKREKHPRRSVTFSKVY